MTISGAEVPAIPDVRVENADLREILQALKTIAEIREGRKLDTGQRFITYYELVDYLQGNDQLVVAATSSGHDHDTLYSILSHDHSGVYAEVVNVEGVYALLIHDHDGLYARLKHDHEELQALYAKILHHHDGLYEPVGPRPWKKITANGVTLGGGPPTSSDTVSDLQTPHDGNTYTVAEIASSAGQNLVIDFTNVGSFSMVQILMRYQSTGHALTIQLEITPFNGTAWHTYTTVKDQPADQNFENHSFIVPDFTPYINSGTVKVRIVHEPAGASADRWVIDAVALYRQ